MEPVQDFSAYIADHFWNIYMILLLLGTGMLLTWMTRGVQVREFLKSVRLVMKGALRKDLSADEKGDITPFQALTTALSATVGNGNIAGVATTIAVGGPGGVLWMWATALVGMATKYAEALLGVRYRNVAKDGSIASGPMYYIRDGFSRYPFLRHLALPLAGVFAVCGAWTSLFGTGNMMQSNSVALAFHTQLSIPYWITGGVVTVLTGLVIIGGIKRIGMVAERLVPTMILVYVGGALVILIIHIADLPAAFLLICKSAFTPQAAIGGFIGHSVKEAIQTGVSRGLLSNESGLGSAPIAHGAAKTKNPVRQGLVAMMGTFTDTIVVCSMTALTIIVTEAYLIHDPETGGTLTSTALTAAAFNTNLPYLGGIIVSIGSFLFGFSTLIGWCYYGEQCMQFLFGYRIIRGYRMLYIVLCFIGSILQEESLPVVWNIGIVSNGLMAIPNLIGLIGLSGVIASMTKEYYQNKVTLD